VENAGFVPAKLGVECPKSEQNRLYAIALASTSPYRAGGAPRRRSIRTENEMLQEGLIYLGTSRHPDDSIDKPEYLTLNLANRHGLITGATGTGKTVSLQILA
jgi:Cdc6-like AAA superfamily ATPase